ncbi:MAG: hypothetical protein HUJ61_07165, partial [Bacilli bacterium]|nr:hypothetical protein [Bacilli bacterium]
IDYKNKLINYSISANDLEFNEDKLNRQNVKMFDFSKITPEDIEELKKVTEKEFNPIKKILEKTKLIEIVEVGLKKLNTESFLNISAKIPEDSENLSYQILIHKEASKLGKYMVGTTFKNDAAHNKDIRDYTAKLINGDFKYLEEIENLINFGPIGAIFQYGGLTNEKDLTGNGIGNLINTIFGMFGNGMYIEQVYQEIMIVQMQIEEVNQRLKDIKNNLTELGVISRCGFDQQLMKTYEQNWDAFVTNYNEPFQTCLSNFKTSLYSYFANKIRLGTPLDIDIRYGKDDQLLAPFSKDYDNPTKRITFTLNDYTNAKKYVEYRSIKDNFADGLIIDLKGALPEGCKDDKHALDAINAIVNNYCEDSYFTSDPDDFRYYRAQDILNKSLNFLDHVSGNYAEGKSILIDVYERLKLLHNFSSEVKPLWQNFLASMKAQITYVGQFAQTTALYSGISKMTELNKKVIDASNLIKNLYEASSTVKNNYSYVVNKEIKVDLIKSNAFSKNLNTQSGNKPTWSEGYQHHLLNRKKNFVDKTFESSTYVLDSALRLRAEDIMVMANRYKGLLKNGAGTQESTFIFYLQQKGFLTWENFWSIHNLNEAGNRRGFLTTYEYNTMKAGQSIRHVWTANQKATYFNTDEVVTYRMNAKRDKNGKVVTNMTEYWTNGYVMEGTFIDSATGSNLTSTVICGYARYDEDHTLWINSERHGFVTEINDNYYWLMTYVN